MRHVMLKSLCIAALSMTFLVSCKKEVENEATNPATKIEPNMVTPLFSVTFTAGHTYEMCVGQGLCHIHTYHSDGSYETYHVPCQASGSDCKWTISFATPPKEGGHYEVDILEYDDQFFLMPDKSILSEDKNTYINIPAQRVRRLDGTSKYHLKDVALTAYPLY